MTREKPGQKSTLPHSEVNSSKGRDPTLGTASRGPKLMTCFSPEHWIPTYTSTTKLLQVDKGPSISLDKGPSISLGMNLFFELQKQCTVLLIPLNSPASP